MALQFSVALRNAILQALADRIGAASQMILYTGAMPANAAAARTGTVVATIEVPDTPFDPPANGVMAKAGVWEDGSADAAGTLGYFTIFEDASTTVLLQGTVTATGGGGDLQVDNTVVTAGQQITINTLTLTAQNA
ncbi:MAG: hypothetical protein AAFW60_04270 [Pseudomonadota bacterium]